MTWWCFMIFVVIFRVFFDFEKFTKHHQVISTPKSVRNSAWNHLTVLWLNFGRNRRFLFSRVQVLVITQRLDRENAISKRYSPISVKMISSLGPSQSHFGKISKNSIKYSPPWKSRSDLEEPKEGFNLHRNLRISFGDSGDFFKSPLERVSFEKM